MTGGGAAVAVAGGIAAAAAAVAGRARHGAAMERAFDARWPHDPATGIIVGAEPIALDGARRGAVLLLHGFNDSPQSIRPLALALHAAGWTVRAPLLPGHGRTLAAFAAATADDWTRAAREAYAALRSSHGDVAVGGLSMGGAIAARLAAEEPGVRAYVGIAPYLALPRGWSLAVALAPLAMVGVRYLRGGGRGSIQDPVAAASIIAYRVSTAGLLRELARVSRAAQAALTALRVPTLIQQSREDPRIAADLAARAFGRIAAADKTLDWITGAGHVLTLDYGHAARESRIVQWLGAHLP